MYNLQDVHNLVFSILTSSATLIQSTFLFYFVVVALIISVIHIINNLIRR